MGAKQSKRSVDISGKEAESAGEVAAAGAGGEGRVEQLADADSLKPQLNGDAHIHEQETDKEKILDSGTPENEKDATTEKENKPEEDNEATPVTNGDSEPANKTENGESTPATEEVKKPKKEKVKKKWSLRSISFSRKDKPKQEKKTKDDEQKTNGDPEKVPEEAGDLPVEPVVTEVAEEAPVQTEVKEEKTPETPVTEPITNGSSTPESVVEESPATSPLAEVVAETVAPVDTAAPTNGPTADAPAPEPATLEAAAPTVPAVPAEPEHLPINGLSLEEPKLETPQVEVNVQKEPEEPTAQVTENAPAPDISVIKEVCVEQMPLIEPTPPPLPANPPPSSVASFAATTMAPELADASLANTAENSVSAQPIDPDTKDPITETSLEPLSVLTDPQNVSTDLPPPTQVLREQSPLAISGLEAEHTNKVAVEEPILEQSTQEVEVSKIEINVNEFNEKLDEVNVNLNGVNEKLGKVLNTPEELPAFSEPEVLTEPISDESQDIVDLPPPPPLVDDNTDSAAVATEEQADAIDQEVHLAKDIIITAHHITENETVNGFEKEHVADDVDTEQENVKNKAKDSLGNVLDTIECNGNLDDLNKVPTEEITEMAPPDQCPPNGECVKVASVEEPLPPPPPASAAAEPAHAATPQEPIAVCDKMADLIPEIPSVPELITETLQETTSDVAVAN